jgi:hypothetical protein
MTIKESFNVAGQHTTWGNLRRRRRACGRAHISRVRSDLVGSISDSIELLRRVRREGESVGIVPLTGFQLPGPPVPAVQDDLHVGDRSARPIRRRSPRRASRDGGIGAAARQRLLVAPCAASAYATSPTSRSALSSTTTTPRSPARYALRWLRRPAPTRRRWPSGSQRSLSTTATTARAKACRGLYTDNAKSTAPAEG